MDSAAALLGIRGAVGDPVRRATGRDVAVDGAEAGGEHNGGNQAEEGGQAVEDEGHERHGDGREEGGYQAIEDGDPGKRRGEHGIVNGSHGPIMIQVDNIADKGGDEQGPEKLDQAKACLEEVPKHGWQCLMRLVAFRFRCSAVTVWRRLKVTTGNKRSVMGCATI